MRFIFMMLMSVVLLYAESIHELLDALQKSPVDVHEQLKIAKMEAKKESFEANFYPKLELFGPCKLFANAFPCTARHPSSTLLSRANPRRACQEK
jgi:hypothetical protein